MSSEASPRASALRRALRSKLGRSIVRVALVLAVLRVLVALATPLALSLAARSRGLVCEYESSSLSLLRSRFELNELTLRPRTDGEPAAPILRVGRFHIDIDLTSTLLGTPRVSRLELDACELVVDIDAQGACPWTSVLGLDRPSPVGEPRGDAGREAFELPLPPDVRAHLTRLRLRVRDASAAPPVELELVADARAELAAGRGELVAWLHAPNTLASARMELQLAAARETAAAETKVEFSGFDPRSLQGWLARAGLEAVGEPLAGSFASRVQLDVLDPQRRALAARFNLEHLRLAHGAEDVFALDALNVTVGEASERAFAVDSIVLKGPRMRARRDADGRVQFAGLAPSASPSGPSEQVPAARGEREDASEPSTLVLSLARFAVASGQLELQDRTTQPPTVFELRDATANVVGLRWNDPEGPATARFALSASLPGVCEALALEGDTLLDARTPRLKAVARADDLTLERLKPHLAEAGLEPEFRAASARARVSARIELAAPPRIDVDIENVRLADDVELLALERAHVGGCTVDTARKHFALGEFVVAGLRTELRRDANGVLHALGMAIRPAARRNEDAEAAGKAAANASTGELPFERFTLGALRAERIAVALSDEANASATRLELRDAGLEATRLELGAGAPTSEGELRAWLACDGLADSVTFEGRVATGAESLALRGAFDAEGLDARPLAPYAAALGLEPTLEAGRAHAELELRAQRANGEWSVDVALADAELEEHGEALASLKSARLSSVRWRPEAAEVEFESADADEPYALAERDEQGRFGAFGFRFAPSPPAALDGASSDANDEREVRPTEPAETPVRDPAPLIPLRVRGDASIRALKLAWRDRTVDPPVQLVLRAEATARELDLGGDGAPAQLAGRASVDGVLGNAAVRLELQAARSSLRARGELHVEEFAPAPLADYLPAGVSFDVRSAEAHLREFDLELARTDAGAFSLKGSLSGFAWRDDERALLSVDRAQLDAPTLDFAAPRFDLRKLDVRGVRASVVQTSPTSVSLLGFEVRQQRAASAAPAARSEAPAAPETRTRRSRVPRLAVGEARFELDELRLSRPNAAPAVLSLTVEQDGPRVWLSPEADEIQELSLLASGALQPLVGALEARANAAPFAPSPTLALDVRLSELRGAGLTELMPQPAAQLDGSALEHGELAFTVGAQLEVRRRGPLELDPSAEIGFAASLADVAFRTAPDSPPVAGLGALRVDGGTYAPRSGALRIASVEIERPLLRVQRDAQGLHALGFVLAAPPREEETSSASTPASAPVVADSEASASGASELPDLSIERVVATGLDVELLDTTGPTPARVPLDALDAELERFSLRGLARGEALSFRATLGASQVELPPRVVADSLLEGMAAGVDELLAGDSAPRASERRPLFAEVNLSGRVAPFPAPTGWAALNVEALELPAFRGPAGALGLEVGDGLADFDVRLRLSGSSGMSVDARSNFSHLSLSEPADGPLARYLALPAPLDTVLFLLKDAEGRHKVSLGFRATSDGLSMRSLALGAATAATEAIARAVASSPLRLLSTLTDAVGVTGDAAAPPPAQARLVEFASGDASLPHAAQRELERISSELAGRPRKRAVLVHELSKADFARAARLVNPSLDDCARLTARMRERKAELTRDRDALAARARAEFALADPAAVQAICERVRALESQIGQSDRALERLLELSQPGAERRAAARARSAAISLGGERIERARRALVALGVDEARIVPRVVNAGVAAELPAGGRLWIWVR